ncbi:hypothetical protein I6F11_05985 [Ensifer sp. NBAIM29]|nr:hypothetical protein [Ensifer sp. NBAIM29]
MEETTLYAYQLSPGNDDLLYFTESLEECQAAALEQRRDFNENDPDTKSLTPWRFIGAC